MSDAVDRLTAALADRYDIQEELGAGGMATVYLAEDLKHHRKVAVKVLRPELAAILGGERFLKEIEVTANLQHPNILPLYDSGEADSFLYYVMPHVEGESLRDKLNRDKQLGVEETIEIAKSVAAALQYAHEHEIVHRDIKPENVLLQAGQALVADFGIALAVSHAGGTRLTETGLSLGTPHYMSPEQATGDRTLDARTDVYSLGAMVYEMLSGDPPHLGSTVQAVVAQIITEEPRGLTARRHTVPRNVGAAVHQALQKLPADRFGSATEFAAALVNPSFGVATGTDATAGVESSDWRSRIAVPVIGLAAVLGLVAAAGWLRSTAEPSSQIVRFALTSQDSTLGDADGAAVSPDGSRIVMQIDQAGREWLYLRTLSDMSQTRLSVGEFSAVQPFFSPDGSEVGFRVPGTGVELRVVPVTGGPARTVANSVRGNAAWGDDGYIYYGKGLPTPAVYRVPAAGGTDELLLSVDSLGLVFPRPLPGGRGVVFAAFAGAGALSQLAVLDLGTQEWRILTTGGPFTAYAESGYLLFNRERFLMAVRFDPDGLETEGQPIPVVEVPEGDMGWFALGGGTLVYRGSPGGGGNEPVLVDRRGNVRQLENVPEDHLFGFPAVSPDGRRMAMRVSPINAAASAMDVWVYELPDGPLTRLTFDGRDDDPSWTPDGRRILFDSDRDGGKQALYWKPWDGSGEAELVLERDAPLWRTSWLPDGRRFVFYEIPPGENHDIGIAVVGQPDSTRMLLTGPYEESWPAVSPDARWLAYESDESGRSEIYVRPLDAQGLRRQVSRQGGEEPAWGHSGGELFFTARDSLHVAQLDTSGEIEVRDVRALFAEPCCGGGYAVLPGDTLFVMFQNRGLQASGEQVFVVHGFLAELEARMAGTPQSR